MSKSRRQSRPLFEVLEDRQLLSGSLDVALPFGPMPGQLNANPDVLVKANLGRSALKVRTVTDDFGNTAATARALALVAGAASINGGDQLQSGR